MVERGQVLLRDTMKRLSSSIHHSNRNSMRRTVMVMTTTTIKHMVNSTTKVIKFQMALVVEEETTIRHRIRIIPHSRNTMVMIGAEWLQGVVEEDRLLSRDHLREAEEDMVDRDKVEDTQMVVLWVEEDGRQVQRELPPLIQAVSNCSGKY
jgi:hypothetical protein